MPAMTLKGTVKVGVSGVPNTDISTDVRAVTINLERNEVSVPSTMGANGYSLQGSLNQSATIEYFTQTSGASASPTSVKVWNAVLTGTTLVISAQLATGAVSATNPLYTFTVAPLAATRGGTADELASDSVDLPIIGDITVATS